MIKTECIVAPILRFSVVRWDLMESFMGAGVGREGRGGSALLSSFYPAAALLWLASFSQNECGEVRSSPATTVTCPGSLVTHLESQ